MDDVRTPGAFLSYKLTCELKIIINTMMNQEQGPTDTTSCMAMETPGCQTTLKIWSKRKTPVEPWQLIHVYPIVSSLTCIQWMQNISRTV